ncbi:hypothetical protein [Candidatus Parabeggiatoa sp. HSG14]|uniref:hypothetical protein n=1 Tax=Candidatus Parabeggiatoa sp. HSG14 TaxID=3055593 RepID=UPI0025A733B8|nr:hypothetical protein [Thiotrichales bacterium HSG14]
MIFHLLETHQLTFLKILQIIFMGLFAVVLIRTAWLCDDAYITFRTIDNFINGYGLRWNVAERVQTYTNPLWMFLLSGFYFVTQEMYFTSIAVSIVLSLMSVYLLVFQIAKSRFSALLALIILIFSNAFIDYSTSGLENPLTYFFIALFFMVYLKAESGTKKTIFLLALIASLAMFNRMDTILLFIPTLFLVLWQNRAWKTVGLMFVGFLPFFVWELFSLIYYGFLFPNTAYAKLNTGLPSYELMQQGINYLKNSLSKDPITLSTIGFAFLLPFLTKQWRLLPLVLGILLSVIYTVRVGGDFMSGRFLTASLFVAVITLSQYPLSWHQIRRFNVPILAIIFLLFIVLLPNPPILSGVEYDRTDFSEGIADERGVYYPHTGLLRVINSATKMPNHGWAIEGKSIWKGKNAVIVRAGVGFLGFYAGAGLHIISPLALTDPLLARLSPQLHLWRIGHFWRDIPQGYYESVKQNKNKIENKELAEFYENIRLVTHGDLLSINRWFAIWTLNFGNGFIGESDVHKGKQQITDDVAYLDFGTGTLTLPKITISATETYTAKLQKIYPESVFIYKLVNFSPIISHSHYFDSHNKRIYLPELKIIGTEYRYEIELMPLSLPLTTDSQFVMTIVMRK